MSYYFSSMRGLNLYDYLTVLFLKLKKTVSYYISCHLEIRAVCNISPKSVNAFDGVCVTNYTDKPSVELLRFKYNPRRRSNSANIFLVRNTRAYLIY